MISIQISDIRFVFDDLDYLEVTVKDVRLGVQVNFDHKSIIDPTSTNLNGRDACDFVKQPFANTLPRDEFSPPGSPLTTAPPPSSFGKIVDDGNRDRRPSRATVFQHRMTSSVSQFWMRVFARAQGHVSFAASVQDINVFQPYRGDGTSQPGPVVKYRSTAKEPGKSSIGFTPVDTIHNLLQLKSSRPRQEPETEYDRLVVLEGVSRFKFDLGFSPKKPLLGEDSLRMNIDLGQIHTSLEALERISSVKKNPAPESQRPKKSPEERWAPESVPRVSNSVSLP